MKRNRKNKKFKCKCHAWIVFGKRALYMLIVLLAAAILVCAVGGESFSVMGFVKDAATALADAAADAFSEGA